MDAGHLAQNLALSAVSIGLGSCQIGSIFDDEINRIVGVDGTEESAIYLSVVGHPELEWLAAVTLFVMDHSGFLTLLRFWQTGTNLTWE